MATKIKTLTYSQAISSIRKEFNCPLEEAKKLIIKEIWVKL